MTLRCGSISRSASGSAILLDRQADNAGAPAVGLAGKVYCLVDAEYVPVEVGDFLTTSDTLGHSDYGSRIRVDRGKGNWSVIRGTWAHPDSPNASMTSANASMTSASKK